MLKRVYIKNWGIIRDATISLESGMITITGETGSGKTLIMNALSFSLGYLSSSKCPMIDDRDTIVELEFLIKDLGLEGFFESEGFIYDEATIIRREVVRGRARCYVNDSPVTLQSIKRLASKLIHIHSQFDSHKVSKESFQLEILDSYSDHGDIYNAYQNIYNKYRIKQKEYEEYVREYSSNGWDREYIEFQVSELDKYDLTSLNQELLEGKVKAYDNAISIQNSINNILMCIRDGDHSALSQIKSIMSDAEMIDMGTPLSIDCSNRMESCMIELQDICYNIEQGRGDLIVSSDEIEAIRGQLDHLYRLYTKYNISSVADLIAIRGQLILSLDNISNFHSKCDEMKSEIDQVYQRLILAGDELSHSRKRAKDQLCDQVVNLLGCLNMKNVEFEIDLISKPPQSDGMDKISFLLNSNKGGHLSDISKSASGGEISRIVFCLNYLTAGRLQCPVILYDEADTGISGETAHQMGCMMKGISDRHQVIVITHLPQIAAKGDSHFSISKFIIDGKTQTTITQLYNRTRVLEIAKMISGDSPSEIAIQNAEELIRGY